MTKTLILNKLKIDAIKFTGPIGSAMDILLHKSTVYEALYVESYLNRFLSNALSQ